MCMHNISRISGPDEKLKREEERVFKPFLEVGYIYVAKKYDSM